MGQGSSPHWRAPGLGLGYWARVGSIEGLARVGPPGLPLGQI
jgi:hypothetical protein